MIVKIKKEKDSWSYFECKIIHSKYSTLEKTISLNAVILFENEVNIDTPKEKLVKVLNLETSKNHLRTIVTDRLCYILNNEGKTIDKI